MSYRFPRFSQFQIPDVISCFPVFPWFSQFFASVPNVSPVFPSFPMVSPVFCKFSQFFPSVFPVFSQFFPVFPCLFQFFAIPPFFPRHRDHTVSMVAHGSLGTFVSQHGSGRDKVLCGSGDGSTSILGKPPYIIHTHDEYK